MRTVLIKTTDDDEVIARITWDGHEVRGDTPAQISRIAEDLDCVRDLTPADGEAFLDAVLLEYIGTAVRAYEPAMEGESD
jgi:hypothetical protein